MKFEFLIFVIFILLFYLFKKNKFKGGRREPDLNLFKKNKFKGGRREPDLIEAITPERLLYEYNNDVYAYEDLHEKIFNKYEDNIDNIRKYLVKKYWNTENPKECQKYFGSVYQNNDTGTPSLMESLDGIKDSMEVIEKHYRHLLDKYINLVKDYLKSRNSTFSTLDLTTCSHKISTVYIYSPNIGLYLHNNSTENGKDYDGFFYESNDDKSAWALEYCGDTITNRTTVHIKSTYYNEYWMSDSLQGEGFKWSKNRDIDKAWNLVKIDDEGYFTLESIYLKHRVGTDQYCLANDIIEGDKFKWKRQNEQNISWIYKLTQPFKSTSDTAIVPTRQLESMSKKEVHIKNNTLGVYLHSNSQGNYGFSNGSKTRDSNWYLEYSGQLTDQTLVHIQSKSKNNKNKYWLSNSDKGFIWSTQKDPEKAWYLIKLDGNNNYAIKSNYSKFFIKSNKAVEGKPFDGTETKDMSNFKIEFE